MKYVGSKNRIAKDILPFIQKAVNQPNCKGYIEPFVGGANMIDKVVCNNKFGLDAQKYLIALLNQASKDSSIFPNTVTKDIYNEVKSNKDKFPDWFVGLVGFCASYNGKWFGGYANGVKTKIGTIRNYTDEAIRNLVSQSKNLSGIRFDCRDFRTISSEEFSGYVIYCDPPYRDTTKYSTNEFPYDEFYDWCREMSKLNAVFVSEYNMPDDFECVWQKELTTTLDKRSRIKSVEKLFIIKNHQ